MAATTSQVRSVQGDTVDLICWRTYGRTAGITEQVLEANPGLADLGAELPIGTLVTQGLRIVELRMDRWRYDGG